LPQFSSPLVNDALSLVFVGVAIVVALYLVKVLIAAEKALTAYAAGRDGYKPYEPKTRRNTGPLPFTGALDVAPVPPQDPHAPPTPALGVRRHGVTLPFKPPSAP
jgi:hypothetical protein